ncbi:hypothetical protein [Lewinella sp. LCG006]|uniref:hypothetical protein n=1 Tax=Lewinella sp. LCG006 TaxID=3231911 RepID=UPI00345FE68E
MENAIIERIKNEARNLQALSDELRVQMALGKAEARDLIERERKALSAYINKERAALKASAAFSADDRRDFLTCIEDLESSLFTEVPTKVKAYDAYKKDILQKIYKLEEAVRVSYPDMSKQMQEILDAFKAKMDAFRVNLALHDKDDPARVEGIRREFTEKLIEVRQLLDRRETEQTKLDHFVEDISESFSYLKRAISNLSN